MKNSDLFKGIPCETIEKLLKSIDWTHHKYNKGEILFMQEQGCLRYISL
ncbi:MAG: hypothetical protein PF692_13175 [Kiritimatiellae bacterium]|nr:hypothetical protein [Kiritimatiellia bacterium]